MTEPSLGFVGTVQVQAAVSPAPPPPDIEELVNRAVAGLGAVKAWAYTSTEMLHGIVEVTAVQVEARASTKARAYDLASLARSLVLALPQRAWDDGIVLKVDEVAGPFWLPDDDGVPRYVMRCSIHYRRHH